MFSWFTGSGDKVSTDETKIDELLSRSVANVLPSKDALKKLLLSGKRLKFYIGTDATGPQLHLGHSTNYLILEKFRKLGHEIVILFGDYTALIGDPSDKEAVRKQQTPAQIAGHIRDWKSQVEKIVDFEDTGNPARILCNSEWLSKLSFSDLIDIASTFTVQQMLERDMFERRVRENKPVYLHEFFYPLMQGYDSVAMNVDVEMGGTDQTFNMLTGRTLQKKYNNKEKFIITTTLLEDPSTGKKLMSKSEGSYIALNDGPAEMFGKTMALPDGVIKQMFIDTTLLSVSEIEVILKDRPRDSKIRLAFELVRLYHGATAAENAKKNFESVFSGGGDPSSLAKEVVVKEGDTLKDLIVMSGAASSMSAAHRLIEEGAVTRLPDTKISDAHMKISSQEKGAIFRFGKKHFVKIRLL
ncbi:MAG: tyrosine--tRNA ligase [Patescibacteria group bacterium]